MLFTVFRITLYTSSQLATLMFSWTSHLQDAYSHSFQYLLSCMMLHCARRVNDAWISTETRLIASRENFNETTEFGSVTSRSITVMVVGRWTKLVDDSRTNRLHASSSLFSHFCGTGWRSITAVLWLCSRSSRSVLFPTTGFIGFGELGLPAWLTG